ncbi:hypothetical protein vBAmePPT11V19_00060 [Alteromonas phage vB_AmeP_PT11-V19]|nr:hypothetical protein vBAmePPT11V19_00060 [Alteromonas phage vB_AmeP_PT11-V19]
MGDEAEALSGWCDEAYEHDAEFEEAMSFNERRDRFFMRRYSERRKPKKKTKVALHVESTLNIAPNKQLMKCHCGNTYTAKIADLNRGWGLSCSKSCAAKRREFGLPAANKVKT